MQKLITAILGIALIIGIALFLQTNIFAVLIALVVPVMLLGAVWEVISNHLKEKGYQKGWDEAEEYFKKRKI